MQNVIFAILVIHIYGSEQVNKLLLSKLGIHSVLVK